MLLLLKLFLFFVSVWADPHICSSKEHVLTCVCHNNESTILQITSEYSVQDIVVRGCGHVELSMGGLLARRINSLEFLDLHTLGVRAFAFQGVQVASHIKMSNISNLLVQHHGFYGLSNVGSLKLQDVSAEHIYSSSFSVLRNIDSLEISECSFEFVDSFAFSVKNVSSVIIQNSRFRYLNSSSFVLENAGNVSFVNVTIGTTNSSSISVNETEWLSVKQCEFGTLSPATFKSVNLTTFAFSECLVHKLSTGAFLNVFANNLEFQNNTFHIAENNSLPSEMGYSGDSRYILIADNGFDCSCNISWMWESTVIAAFMESSHCIYSGMPLASLSPVFEEGSCLAMVNPADSTVGIAKSSEHTEEFDHTAETEHMPKPTERETEVNVKPVLSGAKRHNAFILIYFLCFTYLY